jgi:hypothetical protein
MQINLLVSRGTMRLLFIFLFSTMAEYNFSQAKISGIILNTQNQPLGDASVLLLNSKESSLVKGTVTSKKGEYLFLKIPGERILLLPLL